MTLFLIIHLILDIIKQYPDLLLSNRYSMLRKKMDLFETLKMNKDTNYIYSINLYFMKFIIDSFIYLFIHL